ncbi:MAG TPA: GNAT family N-acetyltransferase [Panacibacter sp.]|nr:GNAT family N-acetyltransferase [Panacibacter sp.]HNP46227.1 GNAT family N-acetyltransferase [Panacibacter sp.]
MEFAIRKATVKDAADVARLFDDYRVWYHQKPDYDGALRFLTERLGNNESTILIAIVNDELAGFTQMYPIFTSVGMGRALLLNDLFVAEKARKKGIANKLLEAAKAYGKTQNCKWLMLQTNNDNYAAQALYEKNGWIKESDFFYSVTI